MKKLILLIFILTINVNAFAQKRKSSSTFVTVYGQITQTSNWCGGARPPRELEEELATPKPIDTYSLYIRKDSNDLSKPYLYKVKTDKNGKFTVRLKAGKYTFVDNKKRDIEVYLSTLEKYSLETENTGIIDKECYKQFIATPDFTITVPKSSKRSMQITHNYHRHCNWAGVPCVEYKGPLPQ